jgi:hypothetical protein
VFRLAATAPLITQDLGPLLLSLLTTCIHPAAIPLDIMNAL